jgi:hypothetical protein
MATDGDIKQRILWAEVRAQRELIFRLCQWGVTVLITVQIAIYYIRRDILARYAQMGFTKPGEPLPLHRYLMGTSFLFLIATIFAVFTYSTAETYHHYRSQLEKSGSAGIELHKTAKSRRYILYLLYYSFPLADLFYRLYITIQ